MGHRSIKGREKKVFIRKSDIKQIIVYEAFDEVIKLGFFLGGGKKIIKHLPKIIIFCDICWNRNYTKRYKTDEEMYEGLKILQESLKDTSDDFIEIETADL